MVGRGGKGVGVGEEVLEGGGGGGTAVAGARGIR